MPMVNRIASRHRADRSENPSFSRIGADATFRGVLASTWFPILPTNLASAESTPLVSLVARDQLSTEDRDFARVPLIRCFLKKRVRLARLAGYKFLVRIAKLAHCDVTGLKTNMQASVRDCIDNMHKVH
jgi:hypothetical protein